jgi:hypothetical protein
MIYFGSAAKWETFGITLLDQNRRHQQRQTQERKSTHIETTIPIQGKHFDHQQGDNGGKCENESGSLARNHGTWSKRNKLAVINQQPTIVIVTLGKSGKSANIWDCNLQLPTQALR